MDTVSEALRCFDQVSMIQVPVLANFATDTLARLASSSEECARTLIFTEVLDQSSMRLTMVLVTDSGTPRSWTDNFIAFLTDGTLSVMVRPVPSE